MNRLQVGDRIKLFGGYDMNPLWLFGGEGYTAKVLSFFDNYINGSENDSRMSISIEFDEPLTLKGLTGKYGFIMGRWEDQKWEDVGVVHVHITTNKISKASDITEENSRWVESHASYEKISG